MEGKATPTREKNTVAAAAEDAVDRKAAAKARAAYESAIHEAGLRELRQGVNNEAGASHGGANGGGTKWRVLVAHERSLRGLDMPSLKTVVLTMMPDTPEDYIHLAGRTGRAGGAAKGRAVSVFTPREFDQAGRLTRALRDVRWKVRRDGDR